MAKKAPASPTATAPAAAAAAGSGGDDAAAIETKIRRLLKKHDPKMIAALPNMLKKFEGKEASLLNMLVKKHGPVPEAGDDDGAGDAPAASAPKTPPRSKTPPPKKAPVKSPAAASASPAAAAAAPASASTTPTSDTDPAPTTAAAGAAPSPKPKPKPKAKSARPPIGGPAAAATATGQQQESHRDRLIRFYQKYEPAKVKDVDTILQEQKGNEAGMWNFLVGKYGPEPPAATAASSSSSSSSSPTATARNPKEDIKERLTRYYIKYDPTKLPVIDQIVAQSAGQEADMWQALLQKYGPEPPAPVPGTKKPYRERVIGFYHKYEPTKLAQVDTIMTQYAGHDEKLIQAFIDKYGPEPFPTVYESPRGAGAAAAPAAPAAASTPSKKPAPVAATTPTAAAAPAAAPAAPTPTAVESGDGGGAAGLDVGEIEEQVRRILQKHDTKMVPALGGMMKKFKGKEQTLLDLMIKKHGPVPAADDPAAVDRKKNNAAASSPSADTNITNTNQQQGLSLLSRNPDHQRQRLIRFYTKYDPQKLNIIDTVMKQYVGSEEEMWKFLINKYGPEPPDPTPGGPAAVDGGGGGGGGGGAGIVPQQPSAAANHRERLYRFYTKYDPTKINLVEANLSKYAGNEDEMWRQLIQKYGPEPELNDATLLLERIRRMYEHYDPTELATMPRHLEQFKGKEQELLNQLQQKYGPEPAASGGVLSSPSSASSAGGGGGGERAIPPSGGPTSDQVRCKRMIERYDPQQLSQFPQLMSQYKGREHELLEQLVRKHGPEPPDPTMPNENVLHKKKGLAPESELYRRIKGMLERYDSGSVQHMGVMLDNYKGREEQLLTDLVARYGEEPPLREMQDAEVLQERAGNVLRHYDPESAGTLPALLQRFAGREEQLLRTLVRRYGPEPLESLGKAREAAIPPTAGENIQEIHELIKQHEPESAAAIPGLLNRYANKEEALLALLRQRYGASINVEVHDPNQLQQDDPRVSGSPASIEQRVRNILAKHQPMDLDKMPSLLKEYEGREEQLLKDLVAKHGPEPEAPFPAPASASASSSSSPSSQQQHQQTTVEATARQKLTALFTHYDRMQLPRIDDWLERYAGREDEMLVQAHKKYSVPPPQELPLWVAPLQRMCLKMGMHELFLEKLIKSMGSNATKEHVTFELLSIWFPDFVSSLMSDEAQRRCLTAKRLARFLSAVAPSRVREIPEILAGIQQSEAPDVVLGDMLITFFRETVQAASVPRLDYSSLREQSERAGAVGAGFIGNVDTLQKFLEVWHQQRHHTRTEPKLGNAALDLVRFPKIQHRGVGPDELLVKPLRTVGTDTEMDEGHLFGSSAPTGGRAMMMTNSSKGGGAAAGSSSSSPGGAFGGGGGGGATVAPAPPPNPLLFSRFGEDNENIPKGRWGCLGCQELREFTIAHDTRWHEQLRDQEMRMWRLLESSNSDALTSRPRETICGKCPVLQSEIDELRHKVHQLQVNHVDTSRQLDEAKRNVVELTSQQQQQSQQPHVISRQPNVRRMFMQDYPPPHTPSSGAAADGSRATIATINAPHFYSSPATSSVSPALQRSADLWSTLYHGEKRDSAAGLSVPSGQAARDVLSFL